MSAWASNIETRLAVAGTLVSTMLDHVVRPFFFFKSSASLSSAFFHGWRAIRMLRL